MVTAVKSQVNLLTRERERGGERGRERGRERETEMLSTRIHFLVSNPEAGC